MEKDLRARLLSLSFVLAALLFSSCGKQAFVVTSSRSSQSPGSYTIPPRVDFVLVQDDTGGINQVLSEINSQMTSFLVDLENQGWNYHFATAKLTTQRPITQILTSKNDSNWGSEWVPAYPGQVADEPGMILSSYFRKPQNYGHFVQPGETNSSLQGWEPAFKNFSEVLSASDTKSSGFLRDDALLVVLVVGNGEDTSDVRYCNRGDRWLPCEGFNQSVNSICMMNGSSSTCPNFAISPDQTATNSLNTYKQRLLDVKDGDSGKIRLFSAVSFRDTRLGQGTCLGGNAWRGTRYMQMATELGGGSYDLCTQPVSSILQTLSGQLAAEKRNFRQKYLFINQRPEPTSIRVVKHPAGQSSLAEEILQDAFNGWTYTDQIITDYAIDAPIPLNRQTGYAIELHGDAKLVGDDTADVTFKPYGAQNAN